MEFSKWHGQGNDFVIINECEGIFSDKSQAARAICDRNFGVGADGLVIVSSATQGEFSMAIYNSDGSIAEMCGNATRCVARFLYENGFTDKKVITLHTLAGIITPELIMTETGEIKTVCVDMGEPRLQRKLIPMAGGEPEENAIGIPLVVQGQTYLATAVSMGNPHCVIFVDDLDKVDLSVVGPQIETHPIFPKKANVEFAQILSESTIAMRVWERGAGITKACGTGSCATLVAAVLQGKTSRKVTLRLDGGELEVEWRENNHLYMSGPAVEVFRGQYLLSL